MTEQALGRLERVDRRDIWVSEATSFTPWLARPENPAVLGEALNIDLAAGLVGYDMPKKRSNQNKGDRNRDSAYEMVFSHSLSQLRLISIRNSLFRNRRVNRTRAVSPSGSERRR
jgi:hypothetical protein